MHKKNTEISITIMWILTIIFIVFKLTGIVAWSWLWVFSPLWLPFIMILGIPALILVTAAIITSILSILIIIKTIALYF